MLPLVKQQRERAHRDRRVRIVENDATLSRLVQAQHRRGQPPRHRRLADSPRPGDHNSRPTAKIRRESAVSDTQDIGPDPASLAPRAIHTHLCRDIIIYLRDLFIPRNEARRRRHISRIAAAHSEGERLFTGVTAAPERRDRSPSDSSKSAATTAEGATAAPPQGRGSQLALHDPEHPRIGGEHLLSPRRVRGRWSSP